MKLLQDAPVEAIDWSTRARNCILRSGCRNLADVATKTDADWGKVRDLGVTTLKEIRQSLESYAVMLSRPEETRAIAGEESNLLGTELLGLISRDKELEITDASWKRVSDDLLSMPIANEAIGVIAAKMGAKWPSNRYEELFADFLLPKVTALWRQRSLGKKKIRVVIRCAIGIWLENQQPAVLVGSHRGLLVQEIEQNLTEGRVPKAIESAFEAAGLTAKERSILVDRYGNPEGCRTLESLGESYGVTRERIRQIKEKSFRKLNRPPDLHNVLARGLSILEPRLLQRLSRDQHGFIPFAPQQDLVAALGGWETLLVELQYESVDVWLNGRCESSRMGWLCGNFTNEELENAGTELVAYLSDQNVPIPLPVCGVETKLAFELVQLAAAHGFVSASGRFLSVNRLGARQDRVLAFHSISRGQGPLLKRKRFYSTIISSLKGDLIHPSTINQDLGTFPQLILKCGSEFILRLTPPWEIRHPKSESTSSMEISKQTGASTDEEEPSEIDQSLYDFAFTILKKRKLWKSQELMNELVSASDRRYAASSIGQVMVSHPQIQRFAPGVWGAAGCMIEQDDYRGLLSTDDCSRYAMARYARADLTPFPLWTLDSELQMCQWARENAPESVYQSLLSVIHPEEWTCHDHLKERWLERKRQSGRYRLAREPIRALSQLPVAAEEMLAALGTVSGRNGVCWMDLNIVHGRAIDSHRAAPFLALLVALGTIHPCKHWQDWHSCTSLAADVFNEYCGIWIRSLPDDGDAVLKTCSAAALEYANSDRLGWISREELVHLAESLGSSSPSFEEPEEIT